jgi:hypothetical protein
MPNEFIKNKECWKEGQYPFEEPQNEQLECETCSEVFDRKEAIEHSIKEQHHSFKLRGSNMSLSIG